jgi:hypothetical protein
MSLEVLVRHKNVGSHQISAEAKSSKTCLFVLGMHRSGTSAFTRILSLLGATLSKTLLPGNFSNPTGHWESQQLLNIHESVLCSAGTTWSEWAKFNAEWYRSSELNTYKQQILSELERDFSESSLFTVKDPRVRRFFPLWRAALREFGAETRVILPFRNPLDVAASLRARDGFYPTHSYLLWLRHLLNAEADSRGLVRAFTRYEDLMEDWRGVTQAMTRELALLGLACLHASNAKSTTFSLLV